MASRTQSLTSVTTWSLRLRAVCSLRPTSPRLVDQGALDVRVDVFEARWRTPSCPASISSPISSRAAAIWSASCGGEQADLGEHAGVGLAGADVVAVQPAVEGDRLGERLDAAVGAAGEPPAPGLLAHRSRPALVTQAVLRTAVRAVRQSCEKLTP